LATKAGTTPLYNAGGANISTRAGMKKGMLAYEDQAGALNATTQTIAGKNGQIVDDQDYVQLVKKNNHTVSPPTLALIINLSVFWRRSLQLGWIQ
jgi:hypothetical protein